MSVFTALNTAVSGLRAQAEALSHISDNVANARTVGFKRIDTSFSDLVSSNSGSGVGVGSVRSNGRITTETQGAFISSTSTTHAAINGEGFFQVVQPSRYANGVPLFDGASAFTRRGDFDVSQNGYLVNGSSYYLQGRPISINADGTSVVSGAAGPIQIDTSPLPAQATTTVEYRANLASNPLTNNFRSDIDNSELLDVSSFASDPLVSGTGIVIGEDATSFLDSSVAGGSVDVFSPSGEGLPMSIRWAKIDSVASGGTDKWNAFYLADADAEGTETAWQNFGYEFDFDSAGNLNPAVNNIPISDVTISGRNVGDINLSISNGITQYSDATGSIRISTIGQNGYGSSELLSVAVSDQAQVNAEYANGSIVPIADITVVSFPSPNELRRLDGGAFRETVSSGSPTELPSPGIAIGALENSNTDIGTEFTKLIVTQQAYSAGARVLTIGDEMLETAINITG